jgi:hypothetical protein
MMRSREAAEFRRLVPVVRGAVLLIAVGLLGTACASGDATCHGGGAEAAWMVEQGWTGSDPVPAVTVGAWVEAEFDGVSERLFAVRTDAVGDDDDVLLIWTDTEDVTTESGSIVGVTPATRSLFSWGEGASEAELEVVAEAHGDDARACLKWCDARGLGIRWGCLG